MLQPLSTVRAEITPRLFSVYPLDYVTGGLPLGGSTLIGGPPGAGKSTLLIEAACIVPYETHYFTGEEPVAAISQRAERLGLRSNHLYVAETQDVDVVCDAITKRAPALCIVDSIQTMEAGWIRGQPGSPSQLRAVTETLCMAARRTRTALVLVSQVVKSADFAGPNAVKHLVDVLVRLESEPVRRLVVTKNRHGPAPLELAVDVTGEGVRAKLNFRKMV